MFQSIGSCAWAVKVKAKSSSKQIAEYFFIVTFLSYMTFVNEISVNIKIKCFRNKYIFYVLFRIPLFIFIFDFSFYI